MTVEHFGENQTKLHGHHPEDGNSHQDCKKEEIWITKINTHWLKVFHNYLFKAYLYNKMANCKRCLRNLSLLNYFNMAGLFKPRITAFTRSFKKGQTWFQFLKIYKIHHIFMKNYLNNISALLKLG